MQLARGPAGRRPYFGVLELELAAMLEQWDVLGVYGEGAMPDDPAARTASQHEYDDLVRPIISHLTGSDDEAAFASALIDVLRDGYGLLLEDSAQRDGVRGFASSAIGWWRSR